MPEPTLTATRLQAGIWHGTLTGTPQAPELEVTHLETPVPGVEIAADPARPGTWALRIPVPLAALTDGVQTILIRDRRTGARLGSFAILAGAALDDDIRAEVDLLRAELDMLKRAFRRHCVETAG